MGTIQEALQKLAEQDTQVGRGIAQVIAEAKSKPPEPATTDPLGAPVEDVTLQWWLHAIPDRIDPQARALIASRTHEADALGTLTAPAAEEG